MPLYEYECTKCHHRFERIQKFSDPHVKSCPNCAGKVQMVVSAPAVYAKKSGSSSSNGSSEKSEKSEKKDDTKPKAESKKSSESK
jgi:putative FmdB family regulatory protein